MPLNGINRSTGRSIMELEERTEEEILEDLAAIYIDKGYTEEEAHELAEMDFDAGYR